MTIHTVITRAEAPFDRSEMVTAAARCWRRARDERAPVQQRLYALLCDDDQGMLAPVFDSLMTLCEAALGRKISVGGVALSSDEHLLLGLLDGAHPRRVLINGATGMASALDCAIRATRVMMALTIGAGPNPPPSEPADPFTRPALRWNASAHRGPSL